MQVSVEEREKKKKEKLQIQDDASASDAITFDLKSISPVMTIIALGMKKWRCPERR